jgi:GntR family transcriptional regulator
MSEAPSRQTVDRKSPVPAYHQLARALSQRIERGDWPPGQKMPTEIQLSKEYQVSRSTVRQALTALERDRFVSREQGRGTFALTSRRLLMNDLSLPAGLAHRSRSQGIDLRGKMLSARRTADVPPSVRMRLALGDGDEVLEHQRLMFLDGAPAALTTSWVPARLVPGMESGDLVDGSISQTLTARYHLRLSRYENQLEVTMCSPEQARLLDTPLDDPLILLTALCVTEDGVAVEDSQTYWRADRVRLQFGVEVADRPVAN